MSGANRVVRYRVEVDAAQAQAQARQLAQTFAREMSTAQRTATMATASPVVAGGGRAGLGAGMLGGLLGGAAGFLSFQAIRAVTTEVANLNVTVTRSRNAFTALSGGAEEAEKRLKAIQGAAGGTMDELTAMNLANRLVALGMADSSGEMEKAVETGRKIATVMGGDVQGALENLSLAAANLSFMRLDQMGISATKVRARMKELTEANQALGKEQAFLQAAMEIANTTFAGIDTSKAVSGTEKLTAALSDLKMALVESPAGDLANSFLGSVADFVRYASGDLDMRAVGRSLFAERLAERSAEAATPNAAAERMGLDVSGTAEAAVAQGKALQAAFQAVDQAVAAGIPGLEHYNARLDELINEWNVTGMLAAEQQAEIAGITQRLAQATSETSAYSRTVAILGQEYIDNNESARLAVAQMAALDQMLAAGELTLEQYTTAVDGVSRAVSRMAGEATAAAAAMRTANTGYQLWSRYAGSFNPQNVQGPYTEEMAKRAAAEDIERRTAQGWSVDPFGRPLADPKSGAPIMQPWSWGYIPGRNDGTEQREWEYQQAQEQARLQEEAARNWSSAADATASDMEAAAEKMASDFKSSLDQVAGLFSPTSVTEEDMALAQAGVYQEKPDEYLRQLRDEVLNGKDYADVDIADAARRAGISGALDPKAILAQFEAAWGDQSLFAGGKNLDLINQEAVQAALARQKDSASGREAIYALFGLGDPESTQQQMLAQASGLTGGANVDPALLQGMTPDASFDPAASLAALRTGFESDETVTALRDIGIGMAGHLYAGFAFGVGEHDWAATILANLEARIVATAVATMATAMESD